MQYNITYREKDKGIQFIISYKDCFGKWKQKSKQGFKIKREAKAAADIELEKLKKSLELKSNLSEEHQGITFKEFADMFIDHEQLYKQWNTIRIAKIAFNKFTLLNDIELTKIKSLDIQKCVDDLIKKGFKESTIKLYLAKIKVLFKSAKDKYKILVESPVQNIDLHNDKSTTEKTALTNSELNILLGKIKKRKYYLVSLIASKCGLRLGEIAGLTWDDIDFKNCIININKQWKKINFSEYGFGELKSKNSKRSVPAPTIVLSELSKYKKEMPTNLDNRIFSVNSLSSLSGKLLETYRKLGFDISVHELRHTYATLLISNGIDFKTAAKLLGHDVEQTMKTYSHVTDDMLTNASKIINNIF